MPGLTLEFEYDSLSLLEDEDYMPTDSTTYLVLTGANDTDGQCMLVANKYDDDYEPDDEWYSGNNPYRNSWEMYKKCDVEWAYRDFNVMTEFHEWTSRTATVLLSR